MLDETGNDWNSIWSCPCWWPFRDGDCAWLVSRRVDQTDQSDEFAVRIPSLKLTDSKSSEIWRLEDEFLFWALPIFRNYVSLRECNRCNSMIYSIQVTPLKLWEYLLFCQERITAVMFFSMGEVFSWEGKVRLTRFITGEYTPEIWQRDPNQPYLKGDTF